MDRSVAGPRARGPLDPRVLSLSPALRVHLAASTALAVVVAAAVLTQAEAVGRLLPRLITGDGAAVVPLAGWLTAAGLVRALAAGLTEGSATRALLATRTGIRRRVLDRVAHLRPDQRHHLGPARVTALATNATEALEPWVRAYLPALLLAVVVPLAAGARILGADPLSALVLALVVPLIPVFMVLIGKATELHAARQWDALQRLAGRFLDVLTGLPTLRLFGRADAQVERVREVTDRYRQATLRTLRVAFLSALVLELLATLSVAVVAVSLGARLTGGDVDLQTALVVLLLAPECLLPIRRVSAAFHAATAGLDAALDVHDALALPVRPDGTVAPPTVGDLVADGITVTDPDRGPRLAPVHLRVGAGELVALAGPSGAGKSTALDVVRGALVPDGGTATLGGVSVGDLEAIHRAAALAWVPQRPHALGTRVRESAALGHPAGPATDHAVDAVLADLDLTALADLPPGHLSGGERRRLATARALVGARLGRHRFLLLDEPTAQLDPEAAQRVVDALRAATRHGTGVLVATHDPRLVAAADRTVALTPDASPPPAPASHTASHTTTEGRPLDPRVATAAPVPDPVPGWAAGHDTPDTDRGLLRWLLGAARPHRARLLGAHALGVLAEACTIGLAGTAAWLIVRAAERPSFADLAVAAVGVRAFGLGKGVLRYAERLASHDATLRLLADLRAMVVARLARLAPTGLPTAGRGEVLTRLVDDIDRLQDGFLRVLGPMVSALTVAAVAVVAAVLLDPGAGLALASGVVVTGLVLPALTHRGARHRTRAVAAERGRLAGSVVDLAEHAEELVACGAEPTWRGRIEERAGHLDHHERRLARTTAATAALAAGAPALTTAAVVLAAGPAGPGLSGPALGVLVLLPIAVIELVSPLIGAGEALARVEASAGRVRSLLHRPDPVAEPDRPAPPPPRADLDLRGVAVGWPDGPLQVEGLQLAVAEADRAVVTGPSGSGKSTLAAALVAFLSPAEGTYRVGGVPAPDLGGDATRRLVTWCQQDPWFADTTLADNLRIADPAATDEDLWAALDVVHLDAWARRLPHGLNTRLARDAETLSGGERQRLALARALLGGQRAVVFDEPTAHLDAPTAAAVGRDLLAATADRAVVLITHDPALTAAGPVYRLTPRAGGPARWGEQRGQDSRAGDPG